MNGRAHLSILPNAPLQAHVTRSYAPIPGNAIDSILHGLMLYALFGDALLCAECPKTNTTCPLLALFSRDFVTLKGVDNSRLCLVCLNVCPYLARFRFPYA